MRVSSRYEALSEKDSRNRADEMIAWLRGYGETRVNSRLVDERRSMPPHVVLDFGNAGMMGVQVEERFGGLALRNRDIVRVLEQAAALDLGIGTWCLVCLFPGVRPIAAFGNPEIKERYLRPLAEGRILAGYAQTEPGAGTHFPAMETRAMAREGGLRLSGTKTWIGNATWASVLTTMAHDVGDDGRRRGLTAYAIPTDRPGVHPGRELLSMGMRGVVQAEVGFDEVAVGPEDVLGVPGRGLDVALDSMSMSRIAIGATCVGAMRRAIQLMHRFAGRRSIATGRLIDHPNVHVALAEASARIRVSEALVLEAADGLDTQESVSAELFAACKTAASEMLWSTADDLVQVLGSRGYDEENLVPQLLRDARVTRIFEGTSEALIAYLGAAALNPRSDLWVYLREEAGDGARADRLMEAVSALKTRSTKAEPLSRTWQSALAGHAALHAYCATALARRSGGRPDEAVVAAQAWIDDAFAASCHAAANGSRDALAARPSAWLEREVAALTESIGDVDQHLPGERIGLDPMLLRDQPDAD